MNFEGRRLQMAAARSGPSGQIRDQGPVIIYNVAHRSEGAVITTKECGQELS
jgi:hypothetical protein